ncbi:hypothetical protein EVA_20263 [gut metagenome]|uniref:Uncharacterized protein n=1 Tax=gut metagenome TaxID=749906 RepID=J9F9Q4_9ZZZZ
MTRSTSCWGMKPCSAILKTASLRLRRLRICADARSKTQAA